MRKEQFQAQDWPELVGESTDLLKFRNRVKENKISLKELFVPGWTGEGLISKKALAVKKCLLKLWEDSLIRFETFENQTKAVKAFIFNEFISYANSEAHKIDEFLSFNDFWFHYKNDTQEHSAVINNFIKIYCYRSVIIYLFRIRFIVRLAEKTVPHFSYTSLFNPVSFLTKRFRNGSSTELFSDALIKTNQYSWYRPSSDYCLEVEKIGPIIGELTTAEVMKIFTSQPELEESNQLQFNDPDYSHTISHKTFGKFINDLLLTFPQLIKKDQNHSLDIFQKSNTGLEVLNCKYVGDYLNSFSLSHWMAQEKKVDGSWHRVISPEFKGKDFHNGPFLRFCQELQFLTFLVTLANELNLNPIEFISSVMRKKNATTTDTSGQMPLFSRTETTSGQTYDRIISNISKLPKNNPHHFLMTKINIDIQELSNEGFFYLFTNQNLFIPSQSEKIQSLLKTIKVEAYFNFEDLKGRGEIPHFLYIFSRKEKANKKNSPFLQMAEEESVKEPCLNFRLKGQLQSFHNFSLLAAETKSFLRTKRPSLTPIFRKEIEQDLVFEFNQDAIVEGKILHSVSSDPNNITHPQFFRNLTNTCRPFDQFFQIEALNGNGTQKRNSLTNGLLGIDFSDNEDFPYVIIVNYQNPKSIQIEIISSESYKAKKEEYGTAYFYYFSLTPKVSDLNINVFREYFNSHLGHQIIQLCLNEGGVTKLKSKLKRLLIPNFFGDCYYSSHNFNERYDLLKYDHLSILKVHPREALDSFKLISRDLLKLSRQFPWHILGILSFFKNNLGKSYAMVEDIKDASRRDYIPFSNPIIIEGLKELELNPLFPQSQNDDVYVDFLINDRNLLNSKLSQIKLFLNEDSPRICLFNENEAIVNFYAKPLLLKFISFILESTVGAPIIEVLQNLCLPKYKELSEVIEKCSELEMSLKDLHTQTHHIISQILSTQISQST